MLGPGTRVDRFIIERLLGRGGMAEVYAARDTQLRRLVALKRLRSEQEDPAATARLMREARAAASFQHPCAVVVFDVFEHDGSPYMAMELVPGRTLRSYIGDASVPLERRIRWLIDVARALGAAHGVGLVHRDVKPHNVMVSDQGTIKVLDFGIARWHHRMANQGEDTSQSLGTLTDPGIILGTPLYASPEQLSAAVVDGRSDQFAWGVMGYELCCGLLPWRRRDAMTMLTQLVSNDVPSMAQRVSDAVNEYEETTIADRTSASVPPPPDPLLFANLPPEVEAVLLRVMRREPEERYPSIDDAADDLEPFAEEPASTRYVPRSQIPAPESSGGIQGRSGTTPGRAGHTPGRTGRTGAAQGRSKTRAGGENAADPNGPLTARSPRRTPGTPPRVPPVQAVPLAEQTNPAVPSARRAAILPGDLPPASMRRPGASGETPVPSSRLSEAQFPSPTPSSDTSTSGRVATGGTTADALGEGAAPPKDGRRAPLWRQTSMILAGFAVLGAGAVGLLSATRSEPPAPPQAAAPQAIVRIGCSAAEVRDERHLLLRDVRRSGQAAQPLNAAEIIGRGACVRLAIALGAPWDPASSGTPLSVSVDTSSAVRVTLTIAGQSASGEAAQPMPAVDAAVRALVDKLVPPPVGAEKERALGAPNEANARKIEAILRRHAARLAADPRAELTEAMTLAPQSPWPRLLAMSARSAPETARLRDETLAATSALPEPLAEAVRGATGWYAPRTAAERTDALSALRRAYAARPDDGQVTALVSEALLSSGLYEEASAVGLRMAERAPDQSLAPLAALTRGGPPDPAWAALRGKLLAALEKLLPESRGWDVRALHEAQAGHVAEARESIELGDALGLPSATGRAWARDLSRAAIEIADDHPEKARVLAQPSLGSPAAPEAAQAVSLLVQANLLEGRVADAETALARDLARLEALDDRPRIAELWVTVLGTRRRLGLHPPDFVHLDKVEEALSELTAAQSPLAPVLRVEAFLARLAERSADAGAPRAKGAKDKGLPDAAELQQSIVEYARKVARGDRARQDDLAISALPLVLATSGLSGVRVFWRSLDRARFSAKLPHLLTYGMACEKEGDSEEAERAYRAILSAPLSVSGLDHLAARLRLSRLLDKAGHKEEAARWRESASHALKGADAGIAAALDRDL